MTKIKTLAFAVLLAVGATTNLPAPPPICSQITADWTCSLSSPQTGVWLFDGTYGASFNHSDVYLNGQLYGQTPYQDFYLPTYLHGSWVVVAHGTTCAKSFGPFVL